MLSLLEDEAHGAETARVGFPYFGGVKNPHFTDNPQDEVSLRTVPVRTLPLTVDGEQRDVMVATVFDLQAAQYGVARGLEGENAAAGYDDDAPYTPAWQGKDHWRAARQGHRRGPPVRRQRRQDERPLDGHHRRRHEPLVSLRHELSRHHQHADDVRLHRQRAVAAGRTTWGRRSCVRKPAGQRWPSPSTGSARHVR